MKRLKPKMGKFAEILFWIFVIVNSLVGFISLFELINEISILFITSLILSCCMIISVIRIKKSYRDGFWTLCIITCIALVINIYMENNINKTIFGMLGIPMWWIALKANYYWEDMK